MKSAGGGLRRGEDFGLQVIEIGRWQRVVLEFFDDGEEVVKGADQRERRRLRIPAEAACRRQKKGRADGGQRNALVSKLRSQFTVGAAGAIGRIGQAEIQAENPVC